MLPTRTREFVGVLSARLSAFFTAYPSGDNPEDILVGDEA
jgi:hypothetical protein